MTKLLSKLAVSLVALAIISQSALAETQPRKKRKGFFESLFGTSDRASTSKKRRAFDRNNDNWWQNDNQDVRIIYGTGGNEPSKKTSKKPNKKLIIVNQTANADPEGIPGLGTGNVEYIAPLLQQIHDQSFAKIAVSGTFETAIRDVLANKSNGLRAVKIEREAILSYYKTTGFKPFWLQNGAVADRAKALIAKMASAQEDGMEQLNYLPVVLSSFEDQSYFSTTDAAELAKFDVALTAAALRYTQHASGGQFIPNRLSLYNDIKTEPVDVSQALRVLNWTPYPAEYLTGLQPSHPQYAIMKAALAKQTKPSEPSAAIPDGDRVKLDQKDQRLIAVRDRLEELGFEATSETAADLIVLDADLAKVLKKFQTANKIKGTGNLDAATVKALNLDRSKANLDRLVVNMERLRWLPKSLGARHIFVNQPAYEVRVMDKGQQIWRSNVIIGREMTQTSAFHDQMETVVFNPSWGVPQSILVNEYLPKLRRDPAYLDKQGFKVVNAEGKVVPSRSINWSAVGNAPPYGVQQPPGGDNALGELKFLFPNQHSIYMHDTPSRKLFGETTRAFSHGCVRVQNPREFASVLLGWDAADIDAATDSGESTSQTLKTKIPVHITYFTAWPNETGIVQFYADVYSRDANMLKAFAEQSRARKNLLAAKIVQN
jgi:L,D-transpeptidase YcbB